MSGVNVYNCIGVELLSFDLPFVGTSWYSMKMRTSFLGIANHLELVAFVPEPRNQNNSLSVQE